MELTFTRSLHQFFQGIPLFSDLSGEELSELLRSSKPFAREPGEVLFREGDPGDGMYVIERGEVAINTTVPTGDDITLAWLGNGAVVGEMALIVGGPRSATVAPLAMTTGYWFSHAAFQELRAGRSLAAYKIIFQLTRTLEERKRGNERRIRSLLAASDKTDLVENRELLEQFGRLLKA